MDFIPECIFCGKSALYCLIIKGVRAKKFYFCKKHRDLLSDISKDDFFRIIKKSYDDFLEMQTISDQFEKAIEEFKPKGDKEC
jgi:hypothetical protein